MPLIGGHRLWKAGALRAIGLTPELHWVRGMRRTAR
eukprot:gene18162-25546_t